MSFTTVLLALFTTLALPVCTLAQANVIENQTTYVYVDASSGSDGNSGTQSSPFLTIGKAVTKAESNNVNGIGTKVLINPGTYREMVRISPTSRQTGATMTFEATQPGTAIIAASDVLTGWNPGTTNPSIYTHSWSYNFGSCTVPSGWPSGIAPVVLRTEMFFVDGVPLTQVFSFSLMRSGTFYVNDAANMVSIWPAPTADMSTAVVEAAVRPQTLSVYGRTNMVLRGLVFEHAANCINQNSANISGSTNVLVDNIQANWNNWGGFGLSVGNLITVQNSTASHNGGEGFGSYRTINTLLQSDESDYNNWRGAMGAFYDWGMGGTKFYENHGIVVDQIHVYRNQAQGLWFDTDHKNITITNASLAENVLSNLQLEQNEGPISLTNSSLCSGGTGMILVNAALVTATGNTFYNNGATNKWQAQVFLGGKSGGRSGSDFETGQYYNAFTESLTLRNNVFADAGLGQFVFGTYLGGTDWSLFASSLTSNNNTWSDGSDTKKFGIPNGKMVDLRGWQGATSEDMASNWASSAQPASSCVVPEPTFADFSVNVDNSTYSMSSGKATIHLHVNSFAYGMVSLSVAGLPSGVTASYSQSALTSGAPVLTLMASSAAVNQTVPITIIAHGGGRVHTVYVMVHVAPGTTVAAVGAPTNLQAILN